MTTTQSDAFSWSRAARLWHYYSPALKPQLWLWPLIALVIYTMGLLSTISPINDEVFATSFLSWLMAFGPLMLLRNNSLELNATLPAKVSEKYVFLLVYFVIIVPALVALTTAIAHSLAIAILGADRLETYTHALTFALKASKITWGVSLLAGMLSPLLCLYGVVAFKRNRALAAIGVLFGVSMALGMLGGIISVVIGFVNGVFDGWNQNPPTPEVLESADLMTAVPFVRLIMWMTTALTALTDALMLWLTYRALRRRQL